MDRALREAFEDVSPDDEPTAPHPIVDPSEALDQAAQGTTGTSDDSLDGTGEIDAIGNAAGYVVRDGKPFRGIEEIDRRDVHRWELDPDSADERDATD